MVIRRFSPERGADMPKAKVPRRIRSFATTHALRILVAPIRGVAAALFVAQRQPAEIA
jgi:hypothetical protein